MDIDVTAELGEDRKPDVFGADDEVVVLIVGVDGAFDEAVGGGVEEGYFGGGEVGFVGGLEDSFAFEGFLKQDAARRESTVVIGLKGGWMQPVPIRFAEWGADLIVMPVMVLGTCVAMMAFVIKFVDERLRVGFLGPNFRQT